MTLLQEFVFALSKTERTKLRPLQFKDTKRKIFLKILECRDPEGLNSAAILKTYKLTDKRYRQMEAEMLAACYQDVAPSGGTELLQYLGNRQLYRHFRKEMIRQEEALCREGERKKLEDFYFKVLLMSEFFLIPYGHELNIRSDLREYLKRYTAVKEPHPCDSCIFRSMEIEDEITKNFTRDFNLETLRTLVDELEEILGCLKQYDYAFAKFKVAYLLAMIYFGDFFPDKDPRVYLQYIIEIIDEHADQFGSVAELIKLGCQSYLPATDKDIEYYKHYLQHPPSTGEGSSLLVVERLLPLMVKAGEFPWIKKFIAAHFPYNIHQIRKDIAVHWWRLLVIYYAYDGNYKDAEHCLSNAFSSNTGKSRNTILDINLRCFSVFLVIMLDGPNLAPEIVTRHIRYARRHGYNRGEGFMMKYLRAVYNLVSHPPFDTANAEKVRNEYYKELGAEQRLYPLFNIIYEKYYR
jgi:tetratricopeptide (TPR) repeat protein